MFPSSSWEPQNITAGCVPFESYFSGITDPETPKLTTEKPRVDAMYLGNPLQEASTGVNMLNMFAQPTRVIQKLQRGVPRKMRRTPKNTLVLEVGVSSITFANGAISRVVETTPLWPLFIALLPSSNYIWQEGTLALSSLTAVWDDASTFTTSFQDRRYQNAVLQANYAHSLEFFSNWLKVDSAFYPSEVSIKLRPHLPEFLEALAKIYEIFVFTTAKQDYADQMLKVLGPQRKLIRHQLYQEDCLCSQGSYVKDLSVVERDLDRTVAVATYLEAFPYQTSNVIVVPEWQGDRQDEELLRLIPALRSISQAVDIRTEIERKHRGRGTVERLFPL